MTALESACHELVALQERGLPISVPEWHYTKPPYLTVQTQLYPEDLLQELSSGLWDKVEVRAMAPGELMVE